MYVLRIYCRLLSQWVSLSLSLDTHRNGRGGDRRPRGRSLAEGRRHLGAKAKARIRDADDETRPSSSAPFFYHALSSHSRLQSPFLRLLLLLLLFSHLLILIHVLLTTDPLLRGLLTLPSHYIVTMDVIHILHSHHSRLLLLVFRFHGRFSGVNFFPDLKIFVTWYILYSTGTRR